MANNLSPRALETWHATWRWWKSDCLPGKLTRSLCLHSTLLGCGFALWQGTNFPLLPLRREGMTGDDSGPPRPRHGTVRHGTVLGGTRRYLGERDVCIKMHDTRYTIHDTTQGHSAKPPRQTKKQRKKKNTPQRSLDLGARVEWLVVTSARRGFYHLPPRCL
ncbi:hypothetical protein K431DRAFT_72540 [Polychaeton citri CBS 116435]|uniref:Uncharacterized protein n=1 Tax=Polychaeton citri CBS 116435 TaxID=1314669 RepID=A0A9P4Q890_9PEZI|nr:hypothetical protein K431DRAFT_72540 [Polychaeton citri CBS 116435]